MNIRDALSLQGADLQNAVSRVEVIDSPANFYLVFRYHYLKADVDAMTDLMGRYAALVKAQPSWFADLLDLRLSIRRHSVALYEIEALLEIFAAIPEDAWRGEAFMVLAMQAEEAIRDDLAQTVYDRSSAAFARAEMPRKSLIAKYNSFACRTRIDPSKKYFVEYQGFVDEALHHGCFDLAGVALANLSRDCHLVGAVELARKHAAEGLHYLRHYDFGSLQYYLTTAHLLNLLLQLNRWEEAVPYYEELKLSPFMEVSEIREVIENYLDGRDKPREYSHLPATWRERLTDLFRQKQERFTSKEEALVETLTSGPLTLDELAARIYGSKIDYESAIARTKQLVHRLKKKAPSLLRSQGGKYVLG